MGTKLKPWPGEEYPEEFANKKSALLRNIVCGNAEAIRDYLSSNLQWLRYYYFGESLLHIAAELGDHPDVLAVLVELGLDVNTPLARAPWGALLTAVFKGHRHAAKWLLEHGAHTTHAFEGFLHDSGALYAMDTGQIELVKMFVERGTPVDTLLGNPPRGLLSSALIHELTELADYLRSKGALTDDEIKARDAKGKPKRKK